MQADLGIRPTTAADIPAWWHCIQDVAQDIFPDHLMPKGPEDFGKLVRKGNDALTATAGGQVIGGAWLTNLEKGYMARYHGFMCPQFRDRNISILAGKESMRQFFGTWKLRKLEFRIPVTNKMAAAFIRHAGAHMDGKLREYTVHKGKWVDYHLATILRGELGQ